LDDATAHILVSSRYKLADGDLSDDIARLKATSKYRLAASHTTSAQVGMVKISLGIFI
jgi:hypothetical protein